MEALNICASNDDRVAPYCAQPRLKQWSPRIILLSCWYPHSEPP